jgi:hypothetical protein
MDDDDSDRKVQFCEWFQHKVHENKLVGKTVWTDERIFKLNVTANNHNCVYWAPEDRTFMWTKRSVYQDSLFAVECHTRVHF